MCESLAVVLVHPSTTIIDACAAVGSLDQMLGGPAEPELDQVCGSHPEYYYARAAVVAGEFAAACVGLLTGLAKAGAAGASKGVDKFRRAPKNLAEKLSMDEAKGGAGRKIMDNLGDPKFKGMEKWQHVHKHPDGTNTVIHYVRDPKTGQLLDFKFK